MKRLGLINYEGDCLAAIKDGEFFRIEDQWGKEVAYLEENEFNNFIDGRFSITDSKGNVWNYTEHHIDAKPSLSKLYKNDKKQKSTI